MLNKEVKPIWLASYPKSGNTWTRIFLSSLLSDKDPDLNNLKTDGIISSRNIIDGTLGIDTGDIPERLFNKYRSELYHKWAESKNKEFLLTKVHDACHNRGILYFPPKITRGVIYIIRNPFDMAASLANHNGTTISKSVKNLCDNSVCLANNHKKLNNQISQFMGSWSYHVESWTNIHRKNILVVRYEDMLNNGLETFKKIVSYLELDYTDEQIQKAIENSSFNKLKEKENQFTFKEKPAKAESFFRSGKVGGWRNEITKEEAQMIIDFNYDKLLKYNYIDQNGNILV
jgi:aryl sulfotransferase